MCLPEWINAAYCPLCPLYCDKLSQQEVHSYRNKNVKLSIKAFKAFLS